MTDTTTPVLMKQINITIESTGRMVALMVPPDLTDAELLELLSWMAVEAGLRVQLRPAPRIIVPFVRPS